ncbi:MAG: PRC-barrel domain-containing protein [Solirubrobacterales bacterium]
MELARPRAFSELVGRRVVDAAGRSLGRVLEARAHWERDSFVLDELLLGRRAMLRRLRGPAQECRGVPWEAVVEVGPERIVVRS